MKHKIILLITLNIFTITNSSELTNPLLKPNQFDNLSPHEIYELLEKRNQALEARIENLENKANAQKPQTKNCNRETKRGALSCLAFVPSGIAFGVSAVTSPPYPGSGYILFGSLWSLAGASAFALYHLVDGCKTRRAKLKKLKIENENLV